jgi:diadenosine tetraphosphate (Ap4A) HIT family hydrolase
MLTKTTACKWCTSEEVPLARNRSHALIDKANATHPGMLIVTLRHVENPFEMTADEWSDLGEMLIAARSHLAQHEPTGFTIGWNVGEAGGQHVFHAHMHVICRFDHEQQTGRGLRDFILR